MYSEKFLKILFKKTMKDFVSSYVAYPFDSKDTWKALEGHWKTTWSCYVWTFM